MLKYVNADWEEIKNIRFTDCHSETDVDEIVECKKLAKSRHAQFFFSSETNNDCNICYDFDDSNPTTSWPYKSFVYIPTKVEESDLDFPVNMKSHLKRIQHMNYIVRIVIKSEIEKYTFTRFYCTHLTNIIATCKLKGLFTKSLGETNFDYEEFNGDAQFYMNLRSFAIDGTFHHLILNTLFVADYQPLITGSSILNLIERMKEYFKIKLVSLADKSNVKLLSLYVYGTTYYQSHNYQYTNYEYDEHCINIGYQQELLKSIQHTNINFRELRACTSGMLTIRESTVSDGNTVCSDEFMQAFDIISVRFRRLLPTPNIELIKIKDLYTLNTQVLKQIELPEHTEAKIKVRALKRFFPEALSTCIYDQIVHYLKKEQIYCIKAIKQSDNMLYVENKI